MGQLEGGSWLFKQKKQQPEYTVVCANCGRQSVFAQCHLVPVTEKVDWILRESYEYGPFEVVCVPTEYNFVCVCGDICYLGCFEDLVPFTRIFTSWAHWAAWKSNVPPPPDAEPS